MKREEGGLCKTLFRFDKQVSSLAQKCSAVGLLKISNPRGYGSAGRNHVVLHYLRIHEETSYAGVVDLTSEMDRVRALFNLKRWEFPSPSALYRSFKRAPMRLWRALLKRCSTLLDRSGQTAIDSTVFERQQASTNYLRRTDRSVETVKITFLIDTADHAILDIHSSAKWPKMWWLGRNLLAGILIKCEVWLPKKGTIQPRSGINYEKTGDEADMEKPVNPLHYRDNRATNLANQLTEAQMCEWFGWIQGSD